MAEYSGYVSASTRSDIVKMNTALSKVHPELEQRGRQRDQPEDQHADQPINEKPVTDAEVHGLESDQALQAFNAFLEKDSVEHPEHRHGQLVSTINQLRALTRGQYGYDDDENAS